ncbi:chalcone isomerase family protein [Hydrogenimonas sp.]
MKYLVLFFAMAIVTVFAAPAEKFPQTLLVEGNVTLRLNGVGTREKFWIDLYRIGLYIPAKCRKASFIIKEEQPQLVKVVIVSSFISDKAMREGIEKGFEKSTSGQMGSLGKRIDNFIAAFASGIQKGDEYDLFYSPGTGVSVVKNGHILTTIPGRDFKEALFGIWLGELPAQQSLKKALLGL